MKNLGFCGYSFIRKNKRNGLGIPLDIVYTIDTSLEE
jgi:hypothetical protein